MLFTRYELTLRGLLRQPAFGASLGAALQLHQQLIPLLDLAFAETNPGPMKSVWDLVGVQAPHLLAPLVNCNPDTSARLRSELQARLVPEAQLG